MLLHAAKHASAEAAIAPCSFTSASYAPEHAGEVD
jgi:hypothetical protein